MNLSLSGLADLTDFHQSSNKADAIQKQSFDSLEDFLKEKIFILGKAAVKRKYDTSDLLTFHKEAIKLFNKKPKSAAVYLSESHVIEGLPSEFADFIIDQADHLSKAKIGNFISEKDVYNQCVCAHLISKYYFKRCTLDEALRRLVKKFKFPKEAQQIDRVLEKFGGVYHDQNFGVFRDADTAYALSFSLLILNTDLHNSAIPFHKKMSLAQFIKNNTGIDSGYDLPKDLLIKMYTKISEKEIIVDQEYEEGEEEEGEEAETPNGGEVGSIKAGTKSTNTSAPAAFPSNSTSGYLLKYSTSPYSIFSIGKKKWVCFDSNALYYSQRKNPSEKEPRVKIDLTHSSITPDRDGLTFHIASTSHDGYLIIEETILDKVATEKVKKLSFRAQSRIERDTWVGWLHKTNHLSGPVLQKESAHTTDALDDIPQSNPSKNTHFSHLNVLDEIKVKKSSSEVHNIDDASRDSLRIKRLSVHIGKGSKGVSPLTPRIAEEEEEEQPKHALAKGQGQSVRISMNRSISSLSVTPEGKQVAPEPLVDVPEAAMEGWMRFKIDEGKWKRRYFALFPDLDGGGSTLFHYVNSELTNIMKTSGLQTQQGYLRLRIIKKIETKDSELGPLMHIQTENISWSLLPEAIEGCTDDLVQLWIGAVSGMMRNGTCETVRPNMLRAHSAF